MSWASPVNMRMPVTAASIATSGTLSGVPSGTVNKLAFNNATSA